MARKFLSPLNLLNLTSDPGTAAEGDFYWNSSTNRLRIYFDGAWADVSSNTVFTNAANTFTVAPQQITIDNAANKGLIVKAAASQSANLQEWQSSASGILASVNSSGNITAAQFIKTGGTSSQFLKADGSSDASTYLTTSIASTTYSTKTKAISTKIADYTLTTADNNTIIEFNSASDLNLTLPTYSNASFSYGDNFQIVNRGSGKVNILTQTGTTGLTAYSTSGMNVATSSNLYANGLYLALSGTTWYKSTDAITWTSAGAPAALSAGATAQRAAYGAGLYVVNTSSGVSTSPDGATWTARTAISSPQSIKYANGKFIVGNGGSTMATSTDGINWTSLGIVAGLSGSSTIACIEYVSSLNTWFATNSSGGSLLKSTDNGSTWSVTGAGGGSQQYLATNGNILIVHGNSTSAYFTSTDGVAFTSRTFPQSLIGKVIHDGTQFVAPMYNSVSATLFLYTSVDGITWTQQSSIAGTNSSNKNTIVVGHTGQYVLLGAAGTGHTSGQAISSYISKNNESFIPSKGKAEIYNYNQNQFVVSGDLGAGNLGTVTSVALTVPTGLSITGSPITSSGTLAISLASGYSIPTTSSQTNWDSAYGWGNHASAGYLTSATAATTYQPLDADLTAIAGLASGTGLLKNTSGTWSLDTSTYLTSAVTSITAGTGLSGGTVTTTGTIALATAYGDTVNPYASKTANYILAAPNGSAGVPTFRALVAADIPTLNQNTTGSAGSVANALSVGAALAFTSGTTFDGSAARTLNLTSVGTAGTYTQVTTDSYGRVTSGASPTTLSGYGITDALSNSTSSTQSGYFGDIYLYDDSTPSHYLQISNSANLTAARLLNINVNDANRTISLSGDLTVSSAATVSGTNTGDQTITLTGDVTGSGTGSFATTLANSGVTIGTYKSVTVDVKGRVTGGTNPTTLSGYGITDALDTSATAQTKSGNLTVGSIIKSGGTSAQFLKADGSVDSSTYLTGNQSITVSGDASGSGTTSISLTLANSGVSAGTYQSVTVDAKGRVTSGTNPTTLSGFGITDALDTSATAQTKSGNLTAAQFIRSGGTSSQFLKADGSVDSSTYLTTSTASSTYAPIASPTFTGTVTLPGSPTSALHAATKQYVDDVTAGLNFHAAVKYATTAALGTSGNLVGGTITTTYNNGTSGVGATLTIATSSNWTAITIDGQSLTAGDRILIKDQSAGLQNGIYTVTTVGAIGNTTSFVFTRATDADNSPSGEMATGDFTFVQSGTSNGGFGYINNTSGSITIGTTAISYVIFNTGQSVIAGDGITESPTPGTIAVDSTVVRNNANQSISGTLTANSFIPTSSTVPTNGIYLPAANAIGIATNSTANRLYINSSGNVGIGVDPGASTSFGIAKSITGGAYRNAVFYGTVASDTTGTVNSVENAMYTQATAFNLNIYNHFVATEGLLGAGSSITTQNAFLAGSNLTSAASNYGFRGQLPASTNARWNLYLDGTAPNYLLGQTTINSTSLQIGNNGTANSTAQQFGVVSSAAGRVAMVIRAAASPTANITEWQDSTGAILTRINNSGQLVSTLNLFAPALSNTSTSNNSLISMLAAGTKITTAVQTNVALTIQNTHATPSGNLTEWQNTGGTAVAQVNSSGSITANSFIKSGGTSSEYLMGDGSTSTSDIVPLDDLNNEFDGINSRFMPKYQGNQITIGNPYRLLLTINGIIQYIDSPDYVWMSGVPRKGFFVDSDGYLQFSEAVPAGSEFDARLMPGAVTTTRTRVYPFKALDILLGG